MKLQIIDILSDDISSIDRDGKDFTITIYGKTLDEKDNLYKSVVCNIIGFKPYFYMKIPDNWTHTTVERILSDPSIEHNIDSLIKTTYYYDPKIDLYKVKSAIEYKELYGFRCNPDKSVLTYKFVRLEFYSYSAMCKYSEAIRKKYHLLSLQKNNKYHHSNLL